MFAEAKKLKGDQYKLDKNKNGKLDSQDFKMLRGEKVEEEVVDEAKKADKDYDGDGKIESPKDEVWGSRLKAAKKAGKLEEDLLGLGAKVGKGIVKAVTGAGKKSEIELLNDPFRKSAFPPKMSTAEKAGIGAGAAAVGAVAAGEASKKEEPKTIQQSNNPTPRSATDRIRDNLGLDSPDYSPKTDPNYKPKDTGPSDEDKEELNKKVKDAIKENYLHMLKRK